MASRNHVAERLRELLAERAIAPGDRLPPERKLAAELGVSRSSLREGMGRLADLGIIEARQGSGTYLAPLDIEDLLATRLLIEPKAARLAAQRRSPADVARLEEAVSELRATQDDAAAFAEADARLHTIVIEASGSLALGVVLAALANLLRHSRATTAPDAAVRAATLLRLEQLVEAIRDRNAAGAERAMRAHLRDLGRAAASVSAP
jgi:GntR family transcriptional repressor for pyruvate dehydrogenase complex